MIKDSTQEGLEQLLEFARGDKTKARVSQREYDPVTSSGHCDELDKTSQNTEYLAMIDKSMKELEEGKVVVKTMEELEKME